MIEANGLEIRVTGDGAEILGELFGTIIAARIELYDKADRKLMDAVLENVLRDALDAEVALPEKDPPPGFEKVGEGASAVFIETTPEKPKKRRGRPRKEAADAGLDEGHA